MFSLLKADDNTNVSKYLSSDSANALPFDILLPKYKTITIDMCKGSWELPLVWHIMMKAGYGYKDSTTILDGIDTSLSATDVYNRQMAVLVKLKKGQEYDIRVGRSWVYTPQGPRDMRLIIYDYQKANSSVFKAGSGTGCIMNNDYDNYAEYDGISEFFSACGTYTPDHTGLFVIGVARNSGGTGFHLAMCSPEPEVITIQELMKYVYKE